MAVALLLLTHCGSPETRSVDPATSASTPIGSSSASVSDSGKRPGRIILVSMDTVRADQVTGYGTVDTAPNLSQIAASGVMFRDFYAASSYTLPATMSMLTGLDPIEHGVWTEKAVLSDEVTTLAEALQRSGYRTQGFHEGRYVADLYGFGRGFDEYKSHDQRKVVEDALWLVLDWMRSASDDPYFLFLHTYAAHDPYGGLERYRRESPERGLPSDEEIEELRQRHRPAQAIGLPSPSALVPASTRKLCSFINQLVNDHAERLPCGTLLLHPSFPETPHFERDREALLTSYGERIRQIDRAIGEIRDLLVELDQWDDTLLIVTADHGEAFFEHGLYRHGYVPFDEVLKVPLILSYPNRLKGIEQHVVTGLTWSLDLMPTILAFAGIPYPGSASGADLSGVAMGRERVAADRAVFPATLRIPTVGRAPLRRVVVQRGFKFIEGHPHFGDPDGFLFDLNASADESRNLRERAPDQFEAFAAKAREYASGLEVHPARDRDTGQPITAAPGEISGVADLSRDETEQLRALGYRE